MGSSGTKHSLEVTGERPPLLLRPLYWLGRLIRRRFFYVVPAALLIIILAAFITFRLLFTPERVNALADDIVSGLVATDVARFTFDRDATVAELPKLDGTGRIVLRNLTLRSPSGDYDVLHVPTVVIHYDLYGLPSAVAKRITLPDGFYAVANFDDQGNWLDASLLKPQAASDTKPVLPEIIVNNAVIVARHPGVLNAPPQHIADKEFFGRRFTLGGGGYFLSGLSASMLRDAARDDAYVINAETNCSLCGSASVTGSLEPDSSVNLRVVKQGLPISRELVGQFTPAITRTIDLLFADDGVTPNTADLAVSLKIGAESAKIDAQLLYRGSFMYRPVPLLLSDVSALITFDGKDLRIVDGSARRGAAKIAVTGSLENVGRVNEKLDIKIHARGLVIEPGLLRALTGEEMPDGSRYYSEWESAKREGAEQPPEPPPIISTLYRQLEPSGVASISLRVQNEPKMDRDAIEFTVLLAGASARYVGSPAALASYAAQATVPLAARAEQPLRSVARLTGEASLVPTEPAEPVAGFPLPLYDIRGAVSGTHRYGEQAKYIVRGLNVEEAQELSQTLGIEARASRRGLTATRRDSRQRFFVNAEIDEARDHKSDIDDSRLVLNVSTENVVLDEELARLVPPVVKQKLRDFGLSGALDITEGRVTVAGLNSGEPKIEVSVDAKQMLAAWTLPGAAAPIRLRDVAGTFRFDQARGTAELTKFTGKAFDSNGVEFAAALQLPPAGGIPRPDQVTFSGRVADIALTPGLFDLLPAGLGKVKEFITSSYSGRVSASIGGVLGRESPPEEVTVAIHLDGGELTYPGLAPMTLTNVVGDFTATVRPSGTTIKVTSLVGTPLASPDSTETGRGRRAIPDTGSSVRLSGTVYLPADADSREGVVELFVDGRGLLLSRELKEGLNKLFDGTPEQPHRLITVWNDLEPSITLESRSVKAPIGRIDVGGRISLRLPPATGAAPVASTADYLFDVKLRGGKLVSKRFTLPLHDVSTDVRLRPGSITFGAMKASAPVGRIEVPQFEWSGTRLTLLVSARDFPLEGALGKAIPPQFLSAYEGLNPSGKSNIDVRLDFLEDRVEFAAAVQLESAALALGVNFTECTGMVTLTGELAGDEGTIACQADLRLTRAVWKEVAITDISSSMQFRDGFLVLPNIRGSSHGGVLRGSLEMDVNKTPATYSGTLSARGVRLSSLATVIAGAEAKGSNEKLIGGVDVSLAFNSPKPDDREGIIGKGRIDIGREPLSAEELADTSKVPPELQGGHPAALGAVPMFGGLYRQLNVGSGEYFNEAYIIFHLLSDRIQIRQLNLISDAVRVEAVQENYILYAAPPSGNQINMTLVPTLFPRTLTLPVIQPALDTIKGVVFRIFVQGTMENPIVSPFTAAIAKQQAGDEQDTRPRPDRTRAGE